MMSVMSCLPETCMSSRVTTCTGLVLVALGLAMREPVTITSSMVVSCGVVDGGDCARACAPAMRLPHREAKNKDPSRSIAFHVFSPS
jgi:hypothetical protein